MKKLTIEEIKTVRPNLRDKPIKVLSNMEIGKEYTFKELNCHVFTWESLKFNHCIDHIGAAMLPSHKVGTFKVSKKILFDIKENNDNKPREKYVTTLTLGNIKEI